MLSVKEHHPRPGGSVHLLAALLVLLETEAGPAAQFPLLLGKVVGSGSAGPGLQNIVDLEVQQQVDCAERQKQRREEPSAPRVCFSDE